MFGLPDAVVKWVLILLAMVGVVLALKHLKSVYDDEKRDEGAAPYIIAVNNQKLEATALLAKKTAEVAAAEKQRDERVAHLVGAYSDERSTQNKLIADLRASHGRLRDTQAAGCGSGGDGATGKETSVASSAPGASGSKEISERLDGLLWDIFRDATATIKQYEFCQAYAIEVSAKEPK